MMSHSAKQRPSSNVEPGGIKATSDEDQPVVFVPGVSRDRSLRTAFRPGSQSGSNSCERRLTMRAKCGIESRKESSRSKASTKRSQPPSMSSVESTKEKAVLQSTPSPAVRPPTPPSHNLLAFPLEIPTKSKASLKDLCPEDKQRIANLIQELARVSEEKEESVQRLRDEQGLFERKIQQLEQQNTLIIQERESLQQQYRECQELLGLYQQYLSQQQEKLNQSIAQLSHTRDTQDNRSHSKVPASEGNRLTPRGASRSALDGSYLGLPSSGAREPNKVGSSTGRGGASSSNNSASLPDCCPSATPPRTSSPGEHERARPQRPAKRRGGGGKWSEPRLSSPRQHATEPRRTNGTSYLDVVTAPQDKPNLSMDPSMEGTLTAPLLGREDWEEKRHRLLLQKMQLEVEREKLQARLAQQEERLLRQNQQLRQSRLDYSRFQRATAAELGHPVSGKENAFPGRDPPPNGHTLPSEEGGIYIAENLGEAELLACEAIPHQSSLQAPPVAAMPPAMPRTPHARLDSSLIELLEVFSPISVPEPFRPPAQRGKPPLHQPPQRAPSTAQRALLSYSQGRYPRTPQQDLEESQILEEIFFIC